MCRHVCEQDVTSPALEVAGVRAQSARKGLSGMTRGETCESLVRKRKVWIFSIIPALSHILAEPVISPPTATHTHTLKQMAQGRFSNYLPNYDLSLKSIIPPPHPPQLLGI